MKAYRKIKTWITGTDSELEAKLATFITADSREFWRLALNPVWRVSTLSLGNRTLTFTISPLCREPYIAVQKVPNFAERFLMYFQGYRFRGPNIFDLDFDARGRDFRPLDPVYNWPDLRPADSFQADPKEKDLTDN